MASSLPSLTDNLAKGLHKDKCEKYKSGLVDATVKDSTLTFKCVDCNKNHEEEFDKGLTKRFENTYQIHMWWRPGEDPDFKFDFGKVLL